MEFEWDDIKNEINLLKHGISFEQAIFIFDQPYVVLGYRQRDGEIRQIMMGEVEGFGVTLVVTTKREKKVRIISARRASKKERSFYYGNQKSIA